MHQAEFLSQYVPYGLRTLLRQRQAKKLAIINSIGGSFWIARESDDDLVFYPRIIAVPGLDRRLAIQGLQVNVEFP